MKMNMNMSMSKTGASAKAVKLRLGMNKLWEDHITWTRMVIVDFAASLAGPPDRRGPAAPQPGRHRQRDQAVLRRGRRQEAHEPAADAHPRGRAGAPGREGRRQRAARARRSRWYANAHQIAVFLSTANPHNWPLKEMDKMMKRTSS